MERYSCDVARLVGCGALVLPCGEPCLLWRHYLFLYFIFQ